MSLHEQADVPCPFCKGSGECGKCLGQKTRIVESKWLRLRLTVSCYVCHGTGQCQLCQGTGTRPRQRVH